MKLSDMKSLLATIEAAAIPSNPDPDISFWIPRSPNLIIDHEKESSLFIDFVIDESAPASDHRIAAITSDTRQVKGDFTLPLLRANFYK